MLIELTGYFNLINSHYMTLILDCEGVYMGRWWECDREWFWPFKPFSNLKTTFCNSAANKGQSTVNYCQSSAFDHPYLSRNDHCDRWLFQEIFFHKYYFYFLKILLNDIELVFLEFKHIYKTQRTSLFSFYLFIFYLLFCNHSMHQCSSPFPTFPLCVNTHNESTPFSIVVSKSLYVITLSTFCSWTGSLKRTHLPHQFSWWSWNENV